MTTRSVTSPDGTRIVYERSGTGPALILVDGAMCSRGMGPMAALAEALEPRFTVYRYDRRGRGESGNTAPYATDREVEDLAALIQEAGGTAHLFGMSSGGALALEAANRQLGVSKLAMYEVPFIVDGGHAPLSPSFLPTLEGHIAQGRPGAAVKQFLRFIGVPGFVLWLMPFMPAWSQMLKLAPTLPYDIRLVADAQTGTPLSHTRWSRASAPALVLAGGKSPAWMHASARAIAAVLPNAAYQSLPDQAHDAKPNVLAPTLAAFFER